MARCYSDLKYNVMCRKRTMGNKLSTLIISCFTIDKRVLLLNAFIGHHWLFHTLYGHIRIVTRSTHAKFRVIFNRSRCLYGVPERTRSYFREKLQQCERSQPRSTQTSYRLTTQHADATEMMCFRVSVMQVILVIISVLHY